MYSTHRLLDQIARFTSLRDLDLLAFSLLKNIAAITRPLNVNMLKLDSRQRPMQDIVYHGGRCNVHYEDIDLQKEIMTAIERLDRSNAEETTMQVGNQYLSLFLVRHDRRSSSFLILRLDKPIPKSTSTYIRSMLEIYRNFATLLIDSQTDELTGLANRKTFDQSVASVYEVVLPEEDFPNDQRLTKSETHENATYWLALLDIDHFKRVNDTFGHLYGDEVLILLAQLMKSCFREDDMLFRFGGEEFVIILRAPNREECTVALERLRTEVETTQFPGVGHVTVSLGVVKMERNVFHVTLMDYADQALYYSKNHGRNQVTFFADMLEKGEGQVASEVSGEIDLF